MKTDRVSEIGEVLSIINKTQHNRLLIPKNHQNALDTYEAHNKVAYNEAAYHAEKKMARKKKNLVPWTEEILKDSALLLKCSCILAPQLFVIIGANFLYVYMQSIVTSKVYFFFIEIFMVRFELLLINVVLPRTISYGNQFLEMNLRQHQKIALQAPVPWICRITRPLPGKSERKVPAIKGPSLVEVQQVAPRV